MKLGKLLLIGLFITLFQSVHAQTGDSPSEIEQITATLMDYIEVQPMENPIGWERPFILTLICTPLRSRIACAYVRAKLTSPMWRKAKRPIASGVLFPLTTKKMRPSLKRKSSFLVGAFLPIIFYWSNTKGLGKSCIKAIPGGLFPSRIQKLRKVMILDKNHLFPWQSSVRPLEKAFIFTIKKEIWRSVFSTFRLAKSLFAFT